MGVKPEGEEYYNFISEMNYFDDDFNDSISHFSATMERVVINLGIIERNINNINDIVKEKMKGAEIEEYSTAYYI